MLKELYIKNLAVISEAVIPFTDSFNVFTGETGAGKSILINGINAVLGQRISKDIVRSGCDKAVITALFSKLSDNAKAKLEELGISYENDEISLTREIMADGGSVARINSRTATVSAMREIGETLVNIHGQHDNQILLSPEKHIDILDSYGDLEAMTADYRETFVRLQEVSRRLKKLAAEERQREQRIRSLKTAAKEIGDANISENEDEQLDAEYKKAINVFDISRTLGNSYTVIDGDENSSGLADSIETMISELSPYSDMITILPEILKRLESVKLELRDISSELIRENDSIDSDPAAISEISARIDVIREIKKKYGPELSDVFETYRNAISEIEKYESSAEIIKSTAAEKDKLLAEVSAKAKKTVCCKKSRRGAVFKTDRGRTVIP